MGREDKRDNDEHNKQSHVSGDMAILAQLARARVSGQTNKVISKHDDYYYYRYF